MTNFERYKAELTRQKFIDGMILNCSGCPVDDCPYRDDSADGGECEEQLEAWCDT